MPTVRAGDGSQVGPAAFAGGGSRPGQGGAAQPAGGGEEVDLRLSESVRFIHSLISHGVALKENRLSRPCF